MTPLRLRMIEDMKSAGLAAATQTVYIDSVRRLAAHYRRSPDQLSEEEVRAYLLGLRERGAALGTFFLRRLEANSFQNRQYINLFDAFRFGVNLCGLALFQRKTDVYAKIGDDGVWMTIHRENVPGTRNFAKTERRHRDELP